MKILYVEDELAHVELAQRTLEDNSQHEFELIHVETIKDALLLLDTEPDIDLILTDLRLPDGSGMDLLNKVLVRPSPPAVVLVTGQGDQEAAVTALKAGAADYLVKQSDYLHRLPVVIANAVAQNQLEREQAAKREAEVRYQSLVERTPAVVFLDAADENETTIYISPRVLDLTGYTPDEWCSNPVLWETSLHPDDKARVTGADQRTHENGGHFQEEYRFIRRDGRVIWIKEDTNLIRDKDGRPLYWQGILFDVTKDKQNEAALQRQLDELAVLQAATAAGTESYSEDEIIEKVTRIIGRIYPEICGVLLLSEDGGTLTPHPSYMGANVTNWQTGYPVNMGITGKAVTLGKILRYGDVSTEPEYLEIATDVCSELCVPIRVSKRIIGVVNIESRESDAFNENDEGLINTIASGLGTSLERLRLFKEEQQRSRELETLYQTTKLLAQSLEPKIIAENLITIIEQILGYEYCAVVMLDEEKEQLVPLALSRKGKNQESYEEELKSIIDKKLPSGIGIIGWVIHNSKAVRSGDISQDVRYLKIWNGIQSELCIPLISRGRAIGALNIETSRRDAYTEKDESIMTALAGSAAIAFENARLFKSELVRRENAEILREATIALTSSVEFDSLFEIILESMNKLVPCDSASIELIQDEYYKVVAGRGIPEYLIGKRHITEVDKWGGAEILRRPVIIHDVRQDNRFEKHEGAEYIRGWMGIPLLTQGKLIGLLNLDSRIPGFFTYEHAALVQTFGNQAAIAIEKARLFQEQNRRSKIIETLADIANEIATTRDVIPALEKISQRALELLKANHVAIYLLQGDSVTLKPVTAHGTYRKEILSHVRRIGEGITGHIFLNGKPEIINDMAKDSRKVKVPGTPEEDAEVDTLMSSPLILRGKPIGVINAWRPKEEGYFNETELNFLVSIANQASICIESGRLFQETKRQAQEAAAIAEVGRGISSTLKLNVVLERIASYAKELMHAETSAVYLTDENTSSLHAIAAIGLDAEEIKNDPLTIGTGILGNIALQKYGEFVNDTVNDPRAIIIKGTGQNPREHIMGVPILFNEKLSGLLAVWRTGDGLEFSQTELEFAGRLAQQAAIALENARLYEAELERRAQAEILQEVTALLSTSLDIHKLYQIILDSLAKLIPHDSASIFLERGQDEMEVVAARGFPEDVAIIGRRFYRTAKWHNLAQDRKALVMSDAQNDPRFEKWKGSEKIHGWMGVPMVSQDRVIGFINLDSHKVNAFTERDTTLVQTFANSAAVAVQNANLFASQREQFEREAVILNLMRAAASSLDLAQVLHTILDQLIKLLGADLGSIQLLEKDQLVIAAAIGFDSRLFAEKGSVPLKSFPLNQYVVSKQEAVLVNDVLKDDRYVQVWGLDRTRSFLLIPLISKGKSIGLITLDNAKPNYFTDRDVEIGVAIANHASIALTNATLYQEALRASERRAVLHRISQDIIRFSQDSEQVYTAIHESASQLMPCDIFMIALQDRVTDEVDFVYIVESGHRYIPERMAATKGLTGKVLSTGKSLIWSDSTEIHQNEVEHFGSPTHVQSVIGVPMKTSGRTIGMISAQCYEPHAYGAEEQALLEMLATHAATAIENSRLYNETQRRIKELEIINRISTALRVAQSLDEMLPILLNETMGLLNTHHGSIWLYDHSSNKLVQRISRGAETSLKHTSLMPNQGIIGHTFSTGKRYVSPETKTDPMLFEENRESMPSGLGGCFIPIQSTAGPVGVLVVLVETGRQISDEINLLGILAEITGNAIHRSQLYEQSQRQVRRLTTLRDIDAAIASSFDLRLTLNILMDQTLTHLGVDAVDIALYYPDLQSLTYLIGSGFRTSSPTRPQMRIGEGLAGQVIIKQQTHHVTNLQNAPESRNELLIKQEGFVSYVGIPLIVKGQIKGVFEVFHRTPLSPTPDWMDFLHTLAGQAAIAIDNSHLFENLQRSNQELIQAYDTTLEGWARALELRDRETEGHTRRVTDLTLRLAKYMGIKDSDLVNIRRGVLLHDIGKMGVPDNILKKTGPLSEMEWGEMRQHPVYAYNLLAPIEYLRDALDIPYCHHEHWDGSGYPRGLKGTQIPLSARIFSIVDIWDALLSDRPYRKAWPRNKVFEHLKEISGKHIDPNVLKVFLKMIADGETETE